MVVGFGIGYDHGQLWWNAVQCCVKCDAKCGAMHNVANTIRRDLKCGIEYMACGVMWYICKMGCNARCGATGCITVADTWGNFEIWYCKVEYCARGVGVIW